MGTITQRRRKDGSPAFVAQISLMRDRKIVHRESKTFERRSAASAWIKQREAALAEPGGIDEAKTHRNRKTLGDAIDRYVAESERAMGRTKTQVLRAIKAHDLADKQCTDIRSEDILSFARDLRTRMKPQTVANYLSHLGSVFAIARPAWGYPLDPQAMSDAVKVARRLGTTSKSRERERRPTLEELDRLMAYFEDVRTRRPSSVPMAMIIAFALFSTRRMEEVTRIAWADLDEKHKRIMVRDMKNPGDKAGNNIWCDLPDPALSIIKAMPKTADVIFPYSTDAIGAAFTRACKVLKIEDLHFHDLRHDGVSRLFEMGLNIPHVAAASGHRSWSSLKRYTHLREAGDKYADWKWIARITEPPARSREG